MPNKCEALVPPKKIGGGQIWIRMRNRKISLGFATKAVKPVSIHHRSVDCDLTVTPRRVK
jgi:hypothetical protein